jgi:hypothetical protein
VNRALGHAFAGLRDNMANHPDVIAAGREDRRGEPSAHEARLRAQIVLRASRSSRHRVDLATKRACLEPPATSSRTGARPGRRLRPGVHLCQRRVRLESAQFLRARRKTGRIHPRPRRALRARVSPSVAAARAPGGALGAGRAEGAWRTSRRRRAPPGSAKVSDPRTNLPCPAPSRSCGRLDAAASEGTRPSRSNRLPALLPQRQRALAQAARRPQYAPAAAARAAPFHRVRETDGRCSLGCRGSRAGRSRRSSRGRATSAVRRAQRGHRGERVLCAFAVLFARWRRAARAPEPYDSSPRISRAPTSWRRSLALRGRGPARRTVQGRRRRVAAPQQRPTHRRPRLGIFRAAPLVSCRRTSPSHGPRSRSRSSGPVRLVAARLSSLRVSAGRSALPVCPRRAAPARLEWPRGAGWPSRLVRRAAELLPLDRARGQ